MELIAGLIEEQGEARAVDLAERLGVSAVAVGKTVQRLRREGYVVAEPYRSIFLTPSGADLAARVQERHQTVVAFLQSIGVPEDVAQVDAEGIEHHVSEQTLDAMRSFVRRRRA